MPPKGSGRRMATQSRKRKPSKVFDLEYRSSDEDHKAESENDNDADDDDDDDVSGDKNKDSHDSDQDVNDEEDDLANDAGYDKSDDDDDEMDGKDDTDDDDEEEEEEGDADDDEDDEYVDEKEEEEDDEEDQDDEKEAITLSKRKRGAKRKALTPAVKVSKPEKTLTTTTKKTARTRTKTTARTTTTTTTKAARNKRNSKKSLVQAKISAAVWKKDDPTLKDANVVLAKCRALREELKQGDGCIHKKSLSELIPQLLRQQQHLETATHSEKKKKRPRGSFSDAFFDHASGESQEDQDEDQDEGQDDHHETASKSAKLLQGNDNDDGDDGGGATAGTTKHFNATKMVSLKDLFQAQPPPTSSLSSSSSAAAVPVATPRSTATVEEAQAKAARSFLEVHEMSSTEVLEGIEQIAIRTTAQILQRFSFSSGGNNNNAPGAFSFSVPSRSSSNQLYVKEIDRIVLGHKTSERSFLNVRESRKVAITTRVLQLLHQVLVKRIHITKRDLFYTDVKLFVDQSESDGVLDDVATMVGCTRSNLHVVASDKGLVVGRINFVEDGDFIDCTKMGVGGKAIPPYIDKITNIQSDADFVLLVEKEAAYMRMAEDRFYNRFPCIVITAKGQPDVATRLFLSRLTSELQIPVLGLVDADPYGLKILSVYMSGSKNMSYDSASLTTPDIQWLGLRPSDLDRYDLPDQCRLDMTENDIKTGKELLKEDFIQKNPKWMKELELMVKTKKKAEIQALSSFGFQFITEQYLPRKLRDGDWI